MAASSNPIHAVTAELAVEPATLAFGRADGAKWSATRTLTIRNVSSRPLSVGLGLLPDDPAGPQLSFSAQPARVELKPGDSAEVAIGVSAGDETPAGAGGVLVVSADGAQPVRVPWAVARREARKAPLVGDVQLSHHTFAPSNRAPVVLAFRVGRVDRVADGEMIEPVGVLELELWTADGRRLGVLARLRDVLPGRYAFGLTGRGPNGRLLPAGSYVLRLRAHPVDGDDGVAAVHRRGRLHHHAVTSPGRRVTLYRAQGCHLCESAARVIAAVRSEVEFELEEVDITGDPELERAYRERIPVVEVDGEEAFTYFVHPDGLRRRLDV